MPDAAIDAAPDAPVIAACREFAAGGTTVPVHVTGSLSGSDIRCPSTCTSVDAPFGGIESAGPDAVVRVDGLLPGKPYYAHLTSAADLNFYVVTGCSSQTGPANGECVLFEDADTSGNEVGRFIAAQASMYIVIDFYASHAPSDAGYTLDVYPETCMSNAQCGGAKPVCEDGTCVECASDFDCADPAHPRCDIAAATCKVGSNACLADDPGDPANDGPAGATVLAANGSYSGLICSSPSSEADYLAFDVAIGDLWSFSLQWTGTPDLDLELFDATGKALGFSFWEHPERVELTYLAAGRYYARVSEFSPPSDPSPVAYTLTALRTQGPGCTSTVDCAAEFRNQLYRGACTAGACVPIAGAGTVSELGACDHVADCATGLECPSFRFVSHADTRDVCARSCNADADCAALGTGYACTTYLPTNFCVQKCTEDEECPTVIDQPPTMPPWYRLTCELATGRCLP